MSGFDAFTDSTLTAARTLAGGTCASADVIDLAAYRHPLEVETIELRRANAEYFENRHRYGDEFAMEVLRERRPDLYSLACAVDRPIESA
jgi:hypothetical protein